MLKDDYKAIYDRIRPSRSLEAETEAQIMAHFDGKKLIKPISRTAVIAIPWRCPLRKRLDRLNMSPPGASKKIHRTIDRHPQQPRLNMLLILKGNIRPRQL